MVYANNANAKVEVGCVGEQPVFVGMQTVDSEVLLLDPPKKGWDDFYDLGIARLWAPGLSLSERELESERAWSLDFVRPSELAEACPGVRCDGIHFGSDYSSYGCHESAALWNGALAAQLRRVVERRRRGDRSGVHQEPGVGRLGEASSDCGPKRFRRNVPPDLQTVSNDEAKSQRIAIS